MINIRFDKARSAKYLEALAAGRAIDAPPDGWSASELLALAGCCYSAVSSKGPQLHGALAADSKGMHKQVQVRDISSEQLTRDIHSAIEFCSILALHARDGRWDTKFGPVVQGTIHAEKEGPAEVIPGEGFKDGWNQ